MAYTVNFTDSVNKGNLVVEENSTNNETSLTLVGRNLSDYGQIVNENFLHLLENFANTSPPINPVEGQLWYDTTSNVDQLKVYDGAQWVSAGGLNKSGTRPDAEVSTIGDLWIDTSNQQLYLYSGSGWILVGPEYSQGSSTGTRFENITSTQNVENAVVITYVNDVPMVIVSDREFRPKSVIEGFEIIREGINISTIGKLRGTVEKAETLLVSGAAVPGNDFARLSVQNIFERSLRIRNNQGLSLGETETLGLTVSGSNINFVNKSNDGYIDFKVSNTVTGIRVNNEGNIGIKNTSPQEALDVTGNIKSSGKILVGSLADSTDVNDGALAVAGGVAVGKNLNVGASLTVQNSITSQNIIPRTGSFDIGTDNNKWNNIYATTFYGSTFRGNLVGDISGSASSAAKLNSETEFNIAGDVATTTPVVFDGQVGGNQKTFNVVLADEFFTGKDTYTDDLDKSEQVLIRKVSSTGNQDPNAFYKTTIQSITDLVPTFAIGMVMPYAGETAPPGWLICNGRADLLRTGSYGPLYEVLGTRYGSQNANVFSIPDLRGRFPLGYLDDAPRDDGDDDDRVHDDPAANILGADGGLARRWIRVSNLPQHTHNLIGDDGTQFFALTNQTGVIDSNTVTLSIAGSVTGTGITVSGGITDFSGTLESINGQPEEYVGDKFSTVPPFVAMNYIIYTGVIE